LIPLRQMKHLIRVFLFNVFALWLTNEILPALVAPGGWQTILFAGFTLSLLMLIVMPILKILFIPINILTFGLLSWLINVIVIYLLTVFVPEIQVQPWTFPGATWAGFVIPAIPFNYFMALIITSFSISIITDILHYVSEE
jgi:putative membrane protein